MLTHSACCAFQQKEDASLLQAYCTTNTVLCCAGEMLADKVLNAGYMYLLRCATDVRSHITTLVARPMLFWQKCTIPNPAHLTLAMPGRGSAWGSGAQVTRLWPSSLTGRPASSLSSTQYAVT